MAGNIPRGCDGEGGTCESLGRRWGLPDAVGWLVRVRDTPPQVGLDRPIRCQNVAGAFDWDGALLGGGRILLVDDVATTGATLAAAAAALRAGGASVLGAATVARTPLRADGADRSRSAQAVAPESRYQD